MLAQGDETASDVIGTYDMLLRRSTLTRGGRGSQAEAMDDEGVPRILVADRVSLHAARALCRQ